MPGSGWLPEEVLTVLEQQTCIVCTEPLGDYEQASCQYCGGRFHQPWLKKEGEPCGHLISHSEALAIVFLCNNCYTETED